MQMIILRRGPSLPQGMHRIDTSNERQMKQVFFGGDPWLIFCTNKTVPDPKTSKLLAKTLKKLGDGFAVGVLDCTDKLPSGNSVFERFNIKPSKSLQSLVLAVNGKVKQIPRTKAKTATALKSFVKKKSKVRVAKLRNQKQWNKYCLKQRVCAALLIATPEDKTIHNLAHLHRGVQFVVVNTSFYQLEDSRGEPFLGNNQGAPPVLHLLKRRKGGAVASVSYNGPFTSHNMGKFLAAHLHTDSEDSADGELLLPKKERPALARKNKKAKKKKKRKKAKVVKKPTPEEKLAKRKAAQLRREQRRRARMDKEAASYIPQVEEEEEVELEDDDEGEGDDEEEDEVELSGDDEMDLDDGDEVDLDDDDEVDLDDGDEVDLDDGNQEEEGDDY